MISVIVSLLLTLRGSARSHAELQLEILALHHQLQVLHPARSPRLRLTTADRLLWVWLSRVWNNWRTALVIVKPETVLTWHRRGFRPGRKAGGTSRSAPRRNPPLSAARCGSARTFA